jgi:zinc protease
MSRSLVVLVSLAALCCGPRSGVHEPRPEPDDSEILATNTMFLETYSIAPELRKALEKQRDKVIPQPEPLPDKSYTFPHVHKGKLDNGLRYYMVRKHDLPLVSLNLVVRAGTAHDPEDLPGLSVFTGDMLREGGTKKRSAHELADDIETLGAELSVITGADYTLVAIDSISEHLAKLLSLMGEMTLEPAFATKEMEMFRKREISRLELSRSDPEWIADYVFLDYLYGAHPYSTYDTTKEALETITLEDVKSFHSSHYTARNAFVIAVGDLNPKTFPAMLKKALSSMPKGSKVKIKWPKVAAPEKRKVVIFDRPGSAQTVIRVGNTTLSGNDPDALPLMVTNHVLGGNASARLFMTLREDKGLTYGCYSHVPMRIDVGAFFVETSTKTPSTAESLEEIFHQLSLFLSPGPEGGIDPGELVDTQRYLAGVLAIKAQTPSSISDLLIDRIVYNLPDDYYDTYVKNVDSVTPVSALELATEHIHPETALIVLVGDAAKIKEAAAKWGDVEVVTW